MTDTLITLNDTRELGRTPWTKHRPVAETSPSRPDSTHNKHPRPWRDSNPQSQQASSRKLKPYTARPLGSASIFCSFIILWQGKSEAPHFNLRSTVSHLYKPTAWCHPVYILAFQIAIFQKATHIPFTTRPNLLVRPSPPYFY